jgi:hypothetical protein
MSVRADVLHRSGGFTGELGRLGGALGAANTCDDTEFCIRAKRLLGGVWAYRERARVQHSVPASRTTWQYFVHRCRMEGNSKAAIADLVGTGDGLSSERRYLWTLASGVLRYAATGRFRCAGVICAGLSITGLTYLKARRARKRRANQIGGGNPVAERR